jgi:hypothetical protein
MIPRKYDKCVEGVKASSVLLKNQRCPSEGELSLRQLPIRSFRIEI